MSKLVRDVRVVRQDYRLEVEKKAQDRRNDLQNRPLKTEKREGGGLSLRIYRGEKLKDFVSIDPEKRE